MSDPLRHTGHTRVRYVRMQHGHHVGLPDGFMVPLDAGAPVPDGWEIIHEREGRFIPGPAPEGARRFGEMSEADAYAVVERFMAGESVADLAHEYAVPVGMIEGAIREIAIVED